jgi:hypothetical protein
LFSASFVLGGINHEDAKSVKEEEEEEEKRRLFIQQTFALIS